MVRYRNTGFESATSLLTLGWQVTPTFDPRYWLGSDARAGEQNDTDLVVVPSERMATHTAIIAQSGSGKSFFLGRLVEEIHARLVGNVPGVKAFYPLLHLSRRHAIWLVDHRGEESRFVDARSPELQRCRVVASELLRKLAECRHRDAKRVRATDGKSFHAFDIVRIRERFELGDDVFDWNHLNLHQRVAMNLKVSAP